MILLAIGMLCIFHPLSSLASNYITYTSLQWCAGKKLKTKKFCEIIFIKIVKLLSRKITIPIYIYINRFLANLICIFEAFFNVGLYCAPFVMTVELVGHEYAAICSILINIPFVAGELILIGLAYLFRNFRTMLRIAFLPPLVMLGLWFFIPESPRWLISRKKFSEAKKILIKASKENGHELTEDQLQNLEMD